jgi:hypothetical protein
MRIVKHRPEIEATLDHDLSDGLIESTNTKIRLLTRVALVRAGAVFENGKLVERPENHTQPEPA